MRLCEGLNGFTRDELKGFAACLGIKGCSKLKKDELIGQVENCFLSEAVFRKRVSYLTESQMKLFRKACGGPADVPKKGADAVDAVRISFYLLGYFEEDQGALCIYEDVTESFKKIDDDEFAKENVKNGWLTSCLNFFNDYYQVAPIEVIYKLFSNKIDCSMDEMAGILDDMPEDMAEADVIPSEQLLPGEHLERLLLSERGLLVTWDMLDSDDDLRSLLKDQNGKDFFIPGPKQMVDMIRHYRDGGRTLGNRGHCPDELKAQHA